MEPKTVKHTHVFSIHIFTTISNHTLSICLSENQVYTHKSSTVIFPIELPSGNLLHSYGKWPIEIVDLPRKNGDFT